MSKPTPQRIRRLNALLERAYGRAEPCAPYPPLDSLIGTILSQNTNAANSREGYCRLKKRFPRWEQAAAAPVSAIASAIRVSGLSNTKAPRIKAILRHVHAERGRYSLAFLRKMPPVEAAAYLCRLPGVGPKTAACVLLFSCGMPVFPVDTHVLRISKRLGLIHRRKSAEEAHKILGGVVPEDLVYSFHVLLIHHGRVMCRAGRPACERCVLRRSCKYYRDKVRSKKRPGSNT
ncbi:MAG: endonuclease III [Planctomycetes bacterium]|nr:endonuclease III [Planctomycetota bacterium]